MAVEGEWCDPRCIRPGCAARVSLKRNSREFKRYGMDIVCKRCWKMLDYRISGPFTFQERHDRRMRKHEETYTPEHWRWHAVNMARTWAQVREQIGANHEKPFPAGLSLLMMELHGVRT